MRWASLVTVAIYPPLNLHENRCNICFHNLSYTRAALLLSKGLHPEFGQGPPGHVTTITLASYSPIMLSMGHCRRIW